MHPSIHPFIHPSPLRHPRTVCRGQDLDGGVAASSDGPGRLLGQQVHRELEGAGPRGPELDAEVVLEAAIQLLAPGAEGPLVVLERGIGEIGRLPRRLRLLVQLDEVAVVVAPPGLGHDQEAAPSCRDWLPPQRGPPEDARGQRLAGRARVL